MRYPFAPLVLLALVTRPSLGASPREGEEYSLVSHLGHFLVVDRQHIKLVSPERLQFDKTLLRTFSFVRVPGSKELFFMQFGEFLVSAFDKEGASSPKFRLFRANDGRVALLAAADNADKKSRCLRATAAGGIEQAAFHGGDDAVWWQLKAASDSAEEACPSSSSMPKLGTGKPRRGKPTRLRAARGVVSPGRVLTTSALTVAAGTAAMLPAGALGAGVGAALAPIAASALGALPGPLAAPVAAAASAAGGVLQGTIGLLRQNEMAAVMAHGLLTDGLSDTLAQALAARHEGEMTLDWRRTRRSAAIAFVTDDLPFALWAKFLWDTFEKLRPQILAAPFLPPWLAALLASRFGIAAMKTVVSQLGYESASTAAYLGMQEGARGGGFKGMVREIKSKFWKAWTSGLAFFSITHLAMFMVPLWWLQPILDNLSSLAYNTYLAMLSYDAENGEEGRRTRELPGSGDDEQATSSTPSDSTSRVSRSKLGIAS